MTNNKVNPNSGKKDANAGLSAFNHTSFQTRPTSNTRLKNDDRMNLNEKKELIELNNRLGNCINSVKDLTLNTNSNNLLASNQANTNSSTNGNTLLLSMKTLEKDLDRLKQLYEDEFQQMRAEIEELYAFKNKYSLENSNLELKLKDFIVKFEDVKKTNQDLMNELNEVRARNNQVEFEIESKILEADKPLRENRQLKKDLEDLIEKLNEKQAISDNEIVLRKDLESKYKELFDLNTFERKLHEQELENLKSQLKVSHEAINNLETKLNELNENENNVAKSYDMEYRKLINEIDALRMRNAQLEERNETLKNSCQNLENVIFNLEEIKKSLEDKIALNDNNSNDYNSINKSRQNQQSRMSFNSTNYLDLNDNQSVSKPETSIKFSDVNEYFNFDFEDNLIGQEGRNKTHNYNNNRPSSSLNSANSTVQNQKLSTNQFIHQQQEQQKLDKQNQELSLIKKRQLQINEPSSDTNRILSFLPGNSMSSPNMFSPPSSTSVSSHSVSNQIQNKTKSSTTNSSNFNSPMIVGGPINSLSYIENKDFTNDLFKNFEKTTFLNTSKQNSSQLSTIDNHVTEASYVGNVKIHEVNKNGYYVRLLNVSNTIDEDLSNYSIQQIVSTMPVAVYRLPAATKLLPGHTLTIWSRTDEVHQQPPHTFVWQEQDRWGTGPECTTVLSKPNGQAVSWTTGCHKYGNIDFDEILPVYTQRRQKSAQIQLNRDKLLPQSIFMPTKHPHGQQQQQQQPANGTSNPLKSTDTMQTYSATQSVSSFANNNNNSSKLLNSDSNNNSNSYSAFQKSFFSNQRINNNTSKLSASSASTTNKIVSSVK